MKREEFIAAYSIVRRRKRSIEISHNGRRWNISRVDCQRLDINGCYDRVGSHALCLNQVAHCRKQGLKESAFALLSMARRMRK